MKLKNYFTGILIIIAFAVNAQGHDEEAEFGDGTRSVFGAETIDFGTISGDYAEKSMVILNNKPSSMKIKSISFTGSGVGVTIVDNVIKTHSKSNIIVAVYPNYIEEDEFERYMLIKTEFQYQEGVIVTNETVYKIIGKIER